MDSKTCSSCLKERPRESFPKRHGRVCRDCRNFKQREKRKQTNDSHTKKYEKTPNGYLMRTYRNMLSRVTGVTKKKAHLYEGLEILSKQEFYEWAKNSEDFKTLFNIWVASDYEYRYAPSVDRIYSDKGYTLDNMRWLPHWKNSQLGSLSQNKQLPHNIV